VGGRRFLKLLGKKLEPNKLTREVSSSGKKVGGQEEKGRSVLGGKNIRHKKLCREKNAPKKAR